MKEKPDWFGRAMIGLFVLIVIGAVVGIYFTIQEHDRWEKWCYSKGGHVVDDTKTVTTTGTNGKPAIGASTTYYCLTSDGRILDIQ
jgi:hypothetical protein